MRGPKPKTHLSKVLSGSRHVKRGEGPPQVPISLPDCPASLTGLARIKWDEVVGIVYDMNIMTEADVPALSTLAQALAICETTGRALEEEGPVTMDGRKNPNFAVWKEAALVAAKLAERFGCDPISRERLKVAPKKEPTAFEKYLAGR